VEEPIADHTTLSLAGPCGFIWRALY